MIFETKRFNIRFLELDDLEPFHDMQCNPNVMRFIKPTMNRDQSLQELNRFINYYSDHDIYFNIWAIVEKTSQEFVGICGVYKNDLDEYEIAYRLRELYWRKGIGGEVSKRLISYCFEQTELEELTAYVRLGNAGSIRLLEREMNFIKEFYSEKGKSLERFYKLKKHDWMEQRKYLIREVISSDATPLTNLTIRSKAHWDYGDAQIEKWLSDLTITEEYITQNILFKLVQGKQIQGYYSLIHLSEEVIKMDNLFIDPQSIGKGYGSILLNHSINIAQSKGYKMIVLDADPHAEAFYAKKGFRVVGSLPTSIEDRFLPIMEKVL